MFNTRALRVFNKHLSIIALIHFSLLGIFSPIQPHVLWVLAPNPDSLGSLKDSIIL